MAKETDTSEEQEVTITVRLPADVSEMLENAKDKTGISKQRLVADAVRAKYSKYAVQPA